MGTHVLLESAKVAKISRFIHVSTDEVYGEQTLDQEAMSEEQVWESLSSIILLYTIFDTASSFRSATLSISVSPTLFYSLSSFIYLLLFLSLSL